MAKKGANRIQVILECTEQKDSGVPGMSRYITTKNRKKYARPYRAEEVQSVHEEGYAAQGNQIDVQSTVLVFGCAKRLVPYASHLTATVNRKL